MPTIGLTTDTPRNGVSFAVELPELVFSENKLNGVLIEQLDQKLAEVLAKKPKDAFEKHQRAILAQTLSKLRLAVTPGYETLKKPGYAANY